MNIVDIYLNASEGKINIKNDIPAQTLTLIGYQVSFDSAAESLACGHIRVLLPCIQGNTVSTGSSDETAYTTGFTGIPILLDNNALTLENGIHMKFQMTDNLTSDSEFKLKFGNSTGFNYLHLIFEYSTNEIV